MAIRFYDEALSNKIKDWVKDPNLKVLKPDEVTRLYQLIAEGNQDSSIKLPLVALSRDPQVELLTYGKSALSRDGATRQIIDNKSEQIRAIPIKISYQLDIYTKLFAEGDEYLRNFIFNLINSPKLTIDIPYNNSDIPHDANIQVVSTIEDTSDIPQRLFSGQFTRWTIKLILNDAYLFSIPHREILRLEADKLESKESRGN